MAVNKVNYGNTTLIDLTDTTATAEDVAQGKYFYTNAGVRTEGTSTGAGAFVDVVEQLAGGGDHHIITGVDISSDTVTAEHLEQGYTAHDAEGNAVVGTLVAGGGGMSIDDFFAGSEPSGDVETSGTTIKAYNCYGRTQLTSVNAPNVTTVGSYAFYGCTKLRSVSFPSISYHNNASFIFSGCTALESVNLPNCTALYGQQIFSNCTSLRSLVLPKLTGSNNNYSIDANNFYGCTSFIAFDVNNPYALLGNAFRGASNMSILVIRGTTRTTSLNNINAFDNTLFASGKSGGTLYVPSSKISDYQSASNWSTILGYANNQIKSIESTHTDPDAPIDLTLYYADGTLIPT